ncbi:hypothetical protein [Nonomuraea sp. LPB2021202275-12-8]|uniref:hypothetical protein n=1 Tax=Nonomuraea sp. LPB2021202275-12-8 TaxID=3120159 RepID=UPI00300C8056
MGSEAFYATAAQVMPTILIALVVEVGFLLRAHGRAVMDLRRQLEEENRRRFGVGGYVTQPDHPAEVARMRWGLTSVAIFWTFVIGEVVAVLALGFRWFNAWTFWPVLICMVLLTCLGAFIPVYRYTSEAISPPEVPPAS